MRATQNIINHTEVCMHMRMRVYINNFKTVCIKLVANKLISLWLTGCVIQKGTNIWRTSCLHLQGRDGGNMFLQNAARLPTYNSKPPNSEDPKEKGSYCCPLQMLLMWYNQPWSLTPLLLIHQATPPQRPSTQGLRDTSDAQRAPADH